MEHLFMIYIGGSIKGSLIELHDMRFVIAQKIEDTYDTLRQTWWGDPQSLHLDAWGVVHLADGYHISIHEDPPLHQEHRLYFLNLGAYDQAQFTELHKNVFIVAKDKQEAKQKALLQLTGTLSPHRDYQYDIDHITDVGGFSSTRFIHLNKTTDEKPFEFITQYVPIGV